MDSDGRRTAFILGVVAVILALFPAALAQTTLPAYPDTIIEVRIEGNKVLSRPAILTDIRSRLGQPYSDRIVREDEERLVKTRKFDAVTSEKTQTDRFAAAAEGVLK